MDDARQRPKRSTPAADDEPDRAADVLGRFPF